MQFLHHNSGSLHFKTAFPPEVVQWANDSTETRLPCEISCVGRILPTVFFLKNGDRISPTSSTGDGVHIVEASLTSRRRILVIESRRGNDGVYQCVGQVGDDGSTAVTSSTYINIQCEHETLHTAIKPEWV